MSTIIWQLTFFFTAFLLLSNGILIRGYGVYVTINESKHKRLCICVCPASLNACHQVFQNTCFVFTISSFRFFNLIKSSFRLNCFYQIGWIIIKMFCCLINSKNMILSVCISAAEYRKLKPNLMGKYYTKVSNRKTKWATMSCKVQMNESKEVKKFIVQMC